MKDKSAYKMFGVPVRLGAFKGRVHPDYDTPEFLRALSDCRALVSGPAARIFLDRRNLVAAVSIPVSAPVIITPAATISVPAVSGPLSATAAADPCIAGAAGAASSAVDAVVKEFRASGFKKIKTLLVPGKALKAWHGAAACLVRRVPTPLPLAYLERRECGIVAENYFIASRVDGALEIRNLLRTLPPEDLSRLLAALARFLVFAHNQGILHRDLSDGNILVRSSRPGVYDLFLIDTNRIRVRREVPLLGRVRNLVRLGVPPAYREDFLRLYLGDRRGGPALRFWYGINKKWYTGFVAFKRALRLKKLAERLGIQ
jgi:hypothetical protein